MLQAQLRGAVHAEAAAGRVCQAGRHPRRGPERACHPPPNPLAGNTAPRLTWTHAPSVPQNVDNTAVVRLLESLRVILVIAGPPKVAHEVIDKQMMAFLRRCVVSRYFNKRLHGLNDVIRLIDTVQRAAPGQSFGWLEPAALAAWLRDEQVAPALLGGEVDGSRRDPHAEITTRVVAVLKFMSTCGALEESVLALLWDQVGLCVCAACACADLLCSPLRCHAGHADCSPAQTTLGNDTMTRGVYDTVSAVRLCPPSSAGAVAHTARACLPT